jgi:uncharacterized cupin superfamily protein
MTGVTVKSLDRPDESRRPSERGRIDLVTLGETTVGRAVFQPGSGSELCEVTHTGYVVSGREGVRMADGTEVELGPGDAFVIGPGHDAWVIGAEPCVTLDFSGTARLVGAPSDESERQ